MQNIWTRTSYKKKNNCREPAIHNCIPSPRNFVGLNSASLKTLVMLTLGIHLLFCIFLKRYLTTQGKERPWNFYLKSAWIQFFFSSWGVGPCVLWCAKLFYSDIYLYPTPPPQMACVTRSISFKQSEADFNFFLHWLHDHSALLLTHG